MKKTYQDADTGIILTNDLDCELAVEDLTGDKETVGAISLDGSLKIVAAYEISVKKDGETVQPDDKVTVSIPCEDSEAKVYCAEADNSLTDMNAEYENGYLVFTPDHFSVYLVAASKAFLLGDVDGDEEVTILDATAIQRHLASLSTQSYDEAAADTDKDGEATILDATSIQRHLANLSAQSEGIGKPISKF